jgi:hypothetical protein
MGRVSSNYTFDIGLLIGICKGILQLRHSNNLKMGKELE